MSSVNPNDDKVRAGSVFGQHNSERNKHKKVGAAALEKQAERGRISVMQEAALQTQDATVEGKSGPRGADWQPPTAASTKQNQKKAMDRQALALAAAKKRQLEGKKLKEMFATLDQDGSGTLDPEEVRKLAKLMGDTMKADQLRNAFAQMDKMNAGEVTFNQFKKWWLLKQEEELKDARKNARAIFEAMDGDGSGTLDKREVGDMAKIIGKKFPNVKLDPTFDLDRDFAEMDEDSEGHITWREFEAWWRDRTGDDAPDIPVLPESMVAKINDIADRNLMYAGKLQRPSQDFQFSARELWRYLRPRLWQLVELQKMWGSLHDLYPTASSSSLFETKPIPPGVRDPDSDMAGRWDLAQVGFLLYVCGTVPFRTSMGISIEWHQTAFWIDVVVDIYFIIDLIFGFKTAYWTGGGILEVDPRAIRNNYLRSWFLIDFVSCLPITCEYAFLISEWLIWFIDLFWLRLLATDISLIGQAVNGTSGGSSGATRIFKVLRLLRLAKLLRIARLKKLLTKYEDLFDANQYLGLMFTIFVILFAAHLMACSWYAIGLGETIGLGGEIIYGWVRNHDGADWNDKDLAEGCDTSSGCAVSYGRRYLTSMFTSFDLSFAFLNSECLL